ncbi:MAG TPA: hypothetical protein VE398_18365 [Acidobacteriota bacterium]|nr:hypothetical protein [Acidobacteriota bacterium]
MNSSNKTWHIVPPEEMRCVWMTAGVISYQLCDREFECDRCPLDAAIRNHLPRTTSRRDDNGATRPNHTQEEGLREDRLYARNHCWTKQIGPGLVRIGIEPGLSSALLAPKAVVFPSTGQHIYHGQISFWIVMEGGTLPVESHLDGIIRGTNHELSGQPHLLCRQPFDKGWLLEVEADAPALEEAALLNREQADSKYGVDQDKFLALLHNATSSGCHQVGTTLVDGGQRLRNIADIIGPDKYFSLLKKAFC